MTKVAKTYGGALYDLATEEGLCPLLFTQLEAVKGVFSDNPDYRKLLSEPSIPLAERRHLLDESLRDRVHPYLLNFIKLLCDNSTLSQFPDCVEAFRKRWHTDQGILEVRAVCAAPLRADLQEKLREKVARMTGKKIELSVLVDDTLLGGIRLELPDRQYDGSVQHQLREIGKLLQDAQV